MTDTEKPCGCRIVPELIPKWDQLQKGTAFAAHVTHCPLHAAAPKLLAACEAAIPLVDTCPNAQYAACDCMRCEVASKIAAAVSSAKERK